MNKSKRGLLIAGGGTLGNYTARELLRLGAAVDVICLEDRVSDDPKFLSTLGDRKIKLMTKEELDLK